jgi:hypothetical protein
MVRSALGILFAVALAGCGGDGGGQPAEAEAEAETGAHQVAEPVTVELTEANGSGQSGSTTLTPEEGTIATFEVAITLSPPSEEPHVAAIHRVTCDDYDPKIPEGASTDEVFDAVSATSEDELGEVRDGSGRATVPGALEERQTGGFSIMVHSPSPPYTPVVCGNIPPHE